jgi:heme/copper-type cytochrome/quinol oxidase subunit 1
MIRINNKPQLIFWISIPIIILIGFINGNEPLFINLPNSYFVIEHLFIRILLPILFGIIGFGYWFMQKEKRKLSKRLNLIHSFLTIGGLILIWILQLIRDNSPESTLAEFIYKENLNVAMYIVILIVFFGQIIYPINLISGLIKKQDKISR